MPVNSRTIRVIKKCRLKLIELAQNGKRMTYKGMWRHLRLKHGTRLRQYLDPIYDCEVRCFGRPDITVILHEDGKQCGKFLSQGRRARSVSIKNDGTRKQREAYGRELKDVYACWGGHPHADVEKLLRS